VIRSILFSAAMLLVLTGCNDQQQHQQARSEPVYSKQFRQEAATVIISASSTNIPASGKILLILDVHAPADSTVTFPALDEQIGTFTIIDGYSEPVQLLENGKLLYRRAWTIAPSQPGTTILEPIEILVGSATVTTEPITVEVTSTLPPDLEALTIRDIAPPIERLPQQETKRRMLLLISLLAVLAAGAVLIRNALRRKPEPPPLPPHEAALLALEHLPADPTDRIHALSAILNSYLEQRYNLPLAGKTLDETLPLLPEAYRDELTEFLTTCQQVRFSNKVPEGFAEQACKTVTDFVEKTREDKCA